MNRTTSQRITSAAALIAWAAASPPGAAAEYHRGFLAIDLDSSLSHLGDPDRLILADLAAEAWRLAMACRVHLYQQRLASNFFSYRAVIARHSKAATIPLTAVGKGPPSLQEQQARHLRRRFALSMPVALLICAHAFDRGGTA